MVILLTIVTIANITSTTIIVIITLIITIHDGYTATEAQVKQALACSVLDAPNTTSDSAATDVLS